MELLLILIPSAFYFIKYALSFQASKLGFLRKSNNFNGFLNVVGVSTAILFYILQGSHTTNIFELNGVGFSIRIDSISITMYTMVSIIAYIVYRFGINYLSGDKQFRRFAGIFSFIVGSVQLLVLSGNLFSLFIFWVLTSIGLQQLLQLYPERKKAVRAAHTKFKIARLADLTLLTAFVMIYIATGTADLNSILNEESTWLKLQQSELQLYISLFIGLTAIIKSVQFPFHTWIFGVLESPTPVSALLHAGLLNAGPFLIIRFSALFAGMEISSSILLLVGAFSAIYGSIVFITQSSLKTGLVFSSIGHMGFSLMLCGLGLYAAALLHLVSHSFYKAYSFLKSGSTIEDVKTINSTVYQRQGSISKIIVALVLFLTIFIGINSIVNQFINIPTALNFVGIIMGVGVFALLVYSIDSKNAFQTSFRVLISALFILILFYSMESITSSWVIKDIANHTHLGRGRTYITYLIIGMFMLATLLQITIMSPSKKGFASALRVHLRNGLYVDSFYRKLSRLNK